jgi:LysM repeat protein
MRQRVRIMFGGTAALCLLVLVFWWIVPGRKPPATDPPAAPNSLLGTSGATLQSKTEPPLVKVSSAEGAKAGPTAPTAANSPTTKPAAAPTSSGDARAEYLDGLRAYEAKELLAARQKLNDAHRKGLPPSEALECRQKLRNLAEQMVFSPMRTTGDPLIGAYVVKQGDTLRKIAVAHKISEGLLADINRIKDRHFVRLNQTLKVINGPFRAVVDKSDHEIQMYLGDVYVAGFRVALGQNGSTPTGKWIVRDQLENPSWADPRSGKRWRADDPENPIGEYWIGLEGVEGEAVGQIGFGIHGTNDESTIGQDVSMGCVRLGAKDIAFTFKLLMPKLSTVVIQD